MSQITCRTCSLAPCFAGWDDCLACGVASTLIEDPDYINFARKLYADDSAWLRELEAEWARQVGAFASAPINFRVRQAS